MTKNRKKALFVSIVLALILYPKSDYVYHENYEILETADDAYAKYRDGFIYIGNRAFLKSVDYHEGDVLVEDQRNNYTNPNMRIYSSYTIRDKESRNDIIEVLQHYEKEHPSIWDRSSESMRIEWFVHNICYDYHYQRDRTTNVDLNNADENLYRNKILQKILRM